MNIQVLLYNMRSHLSSWHRHIVL